MNNILNYRKTDLEDYFEKLGEKKYKATQVFEWIYQQNIYDFSLFSNMKQSLREKLNEDYNFEWIKIVKVEEDRLTKKFLFELIDGEYIEAVLMEHDYGKSVCVSSEIGCNMGCAFCLSGKKKKVRNLEPYEMVEQILLIEQYIQAKVSSVVIMGIGEPFDNYDNVMKFIYIINEQKGLALGSRHITVSTCGIVPKIKEFGDVPLQVNLAISLHAPNNELRNKLMPVNKVYSIDTLIPTLKEYLAKNGRRVTIEYVMLSKINDTVEAALELVHLLKGMNIYVNLIPYNETNSSNFKKSTSQSIDLFAKTLKDNGINVTIRKEYGDNISAACGQLRSKGV